MVKDIKKEENVEMPKKQFRYVCPACTGVAFLSSNKMLNVKVTCEKCGKEFETVEANYVIL